MTRRWAVPVRVGLLVAILSAVAGFVVLSRMADISLDGMRGRLEYMHAMNGAAPWRTALGFLMVHIASAGLSLPLNVPIAVAAGAIFGIWPGVPIVSFGAAAGSTLAMLSSRYLVRDIVQSRYGARLATVETELLRGGSSYLLSLRLMPAVPYTLVNLLFGITRFPVWRFWWVSQVGMLPGVVVFVQAGVAADRLHSYGDILTPGMIAALIGLALLPLLGRVVSRFRHT